MRNVLILSNEILFTEADSSPYSSRVRLINVRRSQCNISLAGEDRDEHLVPSKLG